MGGLGGDETGDVVNVDASQKAPLFRSIGKDGISAGNGPTDQTAFGILRIRKESAGGRRLDERCVPERANLQGSLKSERTTGRS